MKPFRFCLLTALTAFAGLWLLPGCSPLPDEALAQPAPTTLVLALPEEADSRLVETARELARRGEDLSENTLAFDLVYTQDIAGAIEEGSAHIYLAPNTAVAQSWEKLEALELPYLFYNGDYMVSGVNSPVFLESLNKISGVPAVLQRVAFGGYIDLAGTPPQEEKGVEAEPVSIAFRQPFFTQQAQEALGIVEVTPPKGKSPLSSVYRGEAQLAEVAVEKVLEDLEGEQVYLTQHRMVLIDIFFAPEIEETLSAREQAALEEAVVYAAGYCKTLADQAREESVAQARELEVLGRSPNTGNLFSHFGDLYNAQGRRAAAAYDKDLAKLLRQLSIRE